MNTKKVDLGACFAETTNVDNIFSSLYRFIKKDTITTKIKSFRLFV